LTFTPPHLIKAGRLQKKRSRKPKGFSPSERHRGKGGGSKKKTPTGPPPFSQQQHQWTTISHRPWDYTFKGRRKTTEKKSGQREHTTGGLKNTHRSSIGPTSKGDPSSQGGLQKGGQKWHAAINWRWKPKNTHRFVHRTSNRNRKDFTQTPIDLDYTLQQKKDYKKAVSGRPQKWHAANWRWTQKHSRIVHRTSMDQNDPTPEHP